jgi:hypothetical protein
MEKGVASGEGCWWGISVNKDYTVLPSLSISSVQRQSTMSPSDKGMCDM